MIWHEDPELRKAYWRGNVPPDLSKPVACRNPKCEEWFEVPELPGWGVAAGRTAGTRKVYCSKACKDEHYHSQPARKRKQKVYQQSYRSRNRESYNAYMRAYRARRRSGAVTA